jgi:cytidyltransferase-like protein
VILASGCFDGLHAGHVRYLDAAADLKSSTGEVLVVAVAPDAYIEAAKERRPYWPQADRLHTVRALDMIDAAIAQAQPSVASIIRDYRPRVFVKGPDWQGRLPEDVLLACYEVGTVIAFVDTPGRHVSEARG